MVFDFPREEQEEEQRAKKSQKTARKGSAPSLSLTEIKFSKLNMCAQTNFFLLALIGMALASPWVPCQHSVTMIHEYDAHVSAQEHSVTFGLSEEWFLVDAMWDRNQITAFITEASSFFLTTYGVAFESVTHYTAQRPYLNSLDGNFMMGAAAFSVINGTHRSFYKKTHDSAWPSPNCVNISDGGVGMVALTGNGFYAGTFGAKWSQDGSGKVKALQGEMAAYGFYLYGDTTGSVDALRYESFAPMEMFPFSGMSVSCNVYSLDGSRSGQAIGLISNTVNRVDNSVRMRGRVTIHLD